VNMDTEARIGGREVSSHASSHVSGVGRRAGSRAGSEQPSALLWVAGAARAARAGAGYAEISEGETLVT
jgi:hypothetical protein